MRLWFDDLALVVDMQRDGRSYRATIDRDGAAIVARGPAIAAGPREPFAGLADATLIAAASADPELLDATRLADGRIAALLGRKDRVVLAYDARLPGPGGRWSIEAPVVVKGAKNATWPEDHVWESPPSHGRARKLIAERGPLRLRARGEAVAIACARTGLVARVDRPGEAPHLLRAPIADDLALDALPTDEGVLVTLIAAGGDSTLVHWDLAGKVLGAHGAFAGLAPAIVGDTALFFDHGRAPAKDQLLRLRLPDLAPVGEPLIVDARASELAVSRDGRRFALVLGHRVLVGEVSGRSLGVDAIHVLDLAGGGIAASDEGDGAGVSAADAGAAARETRDEIDDDGAADEGDDTNTDARATEDEAAAPGEDVPEGAPAACEGDLAASDASGEATSDDEGDDAAPEETPRDAPASDHGAPDPAADDDEGGAPPDPAASDPVDAASDDVPCDPGGAAATPDAAEASPAAAAPDVDAPVVRTHLASSEVVRIATPTAAVGDLDLDDDPDDALSPEEALDQLGLDEPQADADAAIVTAEAIAEPTPAPVGAPAQVDAPDEDVAPVQAADAPDEDGAPVQAADAPDEDGAPVQAADAPDEDGAPAEAADAPEGDVAPAQVDAPTQVAGTPAEAADAPIEAAGTPIEAADAPIEAADAPIEAADAPIEAADAPIEAADAPIEAAPVAPAEAAPVAATRAPVEAADAPAPTIEESLEADDPDEEGAPPLVLRPADGAPLLTWPMGQPPTPGWSARVSAPCELIVILRSAGRASAGVRVSVGGEALARGLVELHAVDDAGVAVPLVPGAAGMRVADARSIELPPGLDLPDEPPPVRTRDRPALARALAATHLRVVLRGRGVRPGSGLLTVVIAPLEGSSPPIRLIRPVLVAR